MSATETIRTMTLEELEKELERMSEWLAAMRRELGRRRGFSEEPRERLRLVKGGQDD